MNQEDIITLGGRPYRIMGPGTVEHVIWMDHLVAVADLNRSLVAPVPAAPGAASQWAMHIWEQISASGLVFDFLGGMLIAADRNDDDWSPALAQELSARFKKLTDPIDHARIRAVLITVVLSFFEAALPWRKLSAIASKSLGGADREAAPATSAENFCVTSAPGGN